MMDKQSTENDAPVAGHENVSFDLGTPRQYTARGGWNISCECGAPLGDTGYSYDEQEALYRDHLASVAPSDRTEKAQGVLARLVRRIRGVRRPASGPFARICSPESCRCHHRNLPGEKP